MEIVVNDVTRKNFITMWPSMMLAIRNSHFLALDLELSGLGDRKQLSASSIDVRYSALCNIARSRSVISFGLACFCQGATDEDSHERKYNVQVFNLFLLCDDDYIVESQALQFLVKHGFDFNKQYAFGIPYKRGIQEKVDQHPSIRRLFLELILAKVPLIFHNGFIDLVFMYQCFYSDLPNSLQTFVADIFEMFQSGIHDTKYISEYQIRENLSFLEYLFRKCQHSNESMKSAGKRYVSVQSKALHGVGTEEELVSCVLPGITITKTLKNYLPQLCKSFQERGYCQTESSCAKIHSVDLIIISEETNQSKKSRKRSRKRRRQSESIVANGDAQNSGSFQEENSNGIIASKKAKSENQEELVRDSKSETIAEDSFIEQILPRMKGHRAGFDAFMTGYCFACYQTELQDSKHTNIMESRNKIYLTAKDMPLTILKSHFVKTSSNHRTIMADLLK